MNFRIEMLIASGRFKEAEAMIGEELVKNVEDPELYILLARVFCEQRKFKAARDAIGDALTIDPDHPDAYYVKALICRDQGRLKEGLEAVNLAISIDAEDTCYFALKAGILLDDEKWELSLEAANLGLEMVADDESCLFYRGLALAKLGRSGEAEEDSMKLLSLDADDASNHVSRGWVLVESGKGKEAVKHFCEALRIDSSREDARAGLSNAVILTRPVLGWVMRGLQKAAEIPFWWMVAGWFLLARGQRMLENMEGLRSLAWVLDVVIWFVLLLMITSRILFEWSLRSNDLTKHAVSERDLKGLRWASPLMIISIVGFVLWAANGARSFPFFACLFAAYTLIFREWFESENRWVRRWMGWTTLGTVLIGLVILYCQYFVVTERLGAVLMMLEEAKTDLEAVRDDLLYELQEVISFRNWTVVYPTLALVLFGTYADNLREWFEGKAPDADWELVWKFSDEVEHEVLNSIGEFEVGDAV